MAQSPKYIDVPTPEGVTRVYIRYVRRSQQAVTVRFCFLHQTGIEHACDEFGCWDFDS